MTADFDITRRDLLVWAGALAAGVAGSGCQTLPTPGPPGPAADASAALLADLERRSFDYFWDTANPANGLVPDRWPTPCTCCANLSHRVPSIRSAPTTPSC